MLKGLHSLELWTKTQLMAAMKVLQALCLHTDSLRLLRSATEEPTPQRSMLHSKLTGTSLLPYLMLPPLLSQQLTELQLPQLLQECMALLKTGPGQLQCQGRSQLCHMVGAGNAAACCDVQPPTPFSHPGWPVLPPPPLPQLWTPYKKLSELRQMGPAARLSVALPGLQCTAPSQLLGAALGSTQHQDQATAQMVILQTTAERARCNLTAVMTLS